MIVVKLAKTNAELGISKEIRNLVFVNEQKISKELDQDGKDDLSFHFILYLNNNPIGCSRLRIADNNAKLERIAILKEFRGKGLGKELLTYMINFAKRKGITGIFLNAQYYLLDYYQECGFIPVGLPFIEVGIKHIKMKYSG